MSNPKSNGLVLYEGPSMLDGAPIVVIATGMRQSSSNTKTGDIIQTWILRQDIKPTDAVNTGADSSICGNCPHRGTIVDGKNVGRSCYVTVFQAPLNVWKTWKAGKYPKAITGNELAEPFAGRKVRLGAYGDPMAVPVNIWQAITVAAKDWTGYTHQWQTSMANVSAYQTYCMASCDTADQHKLATAQGWRTFRVRSESEGMTQSEIACPASEEAGQRTQCADCMLCAGSAKMAKNIAIIAHGAASKVNAFNARNQ